MTALDKIQTICEFCDNAPALSDTCKERIKDLFRQTVIDALNDAPSRDEVIETLRKKIGEL